MDNAAPFSDRSVPEVKVPSGVAIAALLAMALGLVTLGVVNIASAVDVGFKNAITLNSGIGPYSGKEVIAYGVWFASWIVLHFALRTRDLNVRKWFGVTMVHVFVAVLLVWPPIFEGIAHALTGGA